MWAPGQASRRSTWHQLHWTLAVVPTSAADHRCCSTRGSLKGNRGSGCTSCGSPCCEQRLWDLVVTSVTSRLLTPANNVNLCHLQYFRAAATSNRNDPCGILPDCWSSDPSASDVITGGFLHCEPCSHLQADYCHHGCRLSVGQLCVPAQQLPPVELFSGSSFPS